MTCVIRIVARIDDQPTPYDNQYVKEYDSSSSGPGYPSEPGVCYLVTTPNKAEALQFSTPKEAWDLWGKVDARQPTRPWDGKPNRPLTAFTVSIESA